METNCPICLDHIIKKFTFNCNHSICKNCLRNMSKKGQTIIYDISFQEFKLKLIRCPICRCDIYNKSQCDYINILDECFPSILK